MNLLKEWVEAERGRIAGLARALRKSSSYVHRMVNGLKPIPTNCGAQIESFTGGVVSRRDMFPQDWGLIWPELITPEHPWVPHQPTAGEAVEKI